MKKQFYSGGICILTILILSISLVPVSCRKDFNLTETRQVNNASEYIERAKKWYNESWRNPTAYSRLSPWLHDTSFIINNYANLILDWRFARVVNQGGYTYTEVPATLPDTLEFKIGPPNDDTTGFLNLIVDSIYRNQSQSKLFWVMRESPGEDPIAEIVTFVGDYQYTKENYQRFINSVSYFDLVGYTGLVLYHDRFGKLIRSLNYVRGEITNTIRCGVEGGLDPAPGNRVHNDVCYEILTWERECTTYYQDGIEVGRECTDWFLIGSRMVGNCWGGGGSGGSENYHPHKPGEQGLDCSTFEFTQTAGNWQEAGVKNSRVNMLWLGGSRRGEYIPVTITAPIIIGLPMHFRPGTAANIAAEACGHGEDAVSKLLKRQPTRPADAQIDQVYREAVDRFLRKYGGTAGRVRQNMSPNVIINNAQYRLWGHGDCD